MRIKKFIFKFIDYDKKTSTLISMKVVCDKKLQWVHHHDAEKKAMWAAKKTLFKEQLVHRLKEIIRQRFFPDVQEKFGDYVLSKECVKKECKLLNINQDKNSNEIVFRQTNMMFIKIMKFKRGNKPQNWHEILDYPVNVHSFLFKLESEENDSKNIELRELNRVSYTTNQENSIQMDVNAEENPNNRAQSVANNSNQLGGKNYEKLYRKYKSRYLDLKSSNQY